MSEAGRASYRYELDLVKLVSNWMNIPMGGVPKMGKGNNRSYIGIEAITPE